MRFLLCASMLVMAPASDLPANAAPNAALPTHITSGYPQPDPAQSEDALRMPSQLPAVAQAPGSLAPISSPTPTVVQPATSHDVKMAVADLAAHTTAAHESILQKIEAGFEKVGAIVKDVVVDLPKVLADTPAVRVAISGIIADALVVFKDVETEYTDATALNFPAAVTLAPTTIAAFAKVVADVKAGNTVVIADLKALGVPV